MNQRAPQQQDKGTPRQKIGAILLGVAAVSGVLQALMAALRGLDGVLLWGQEKPVKGPVDIPVYLEQASVAGVTIALALWGCLWVGVPKHHPQLIHLGVILTRPFRVHRGLAAVSFAFAVVLAAHLLSQLLDGQPLLAGQSVNGDVWTGFLLGARASLMEESVDLIVVIGMVLVAANTWWGFTSWPRGARIALMAGLVFLSSVIRGMQHIYQDDHRLYVTFLLGVGWALVFVWARSVWPVIIAHWFFDWWYFTQSLTVVVPLLIVTLVCGLVAWRLHRKAPSPPPAPHAGPVR